MSNIGYDQNFECMICFDNRNKYFAHTLVDMSAPTFTRYEIEEHLRTKHTLHDILQWLAAHHHEVMMERISPTSRCNYSNERVVTTDLINRLKEEFVIKPKSKKKKNVRVGRKSDKTKKKKIPRKKQLKVKARITHK